MSHIIICDNCEKKLTGTTSGEKYYRDSYLTLINHVCESPYVSKEKTLPDKHFCWEGCLKDYYSNVTITKRAGVGGCVIKSTTSRQIE